MSTSSFPPHFLWGSATSAHQVEGDNTRSDWWSWEEAGRTPHRSGKACNHWLEYESDFDLARSVGQNAHRFSVEWSRVEPEEGQWNESALAHYREVVAALKARHLEPVVTLHHFTNPKWFSDRGGWSHSRAPALYLGYVQKVIRALGDDVRWWITINEPLVYVYQSLLTDTWPSNRSGAGAAVSAIRNFEKAHLAAYERIHYFFRTKSVKPHVGIAKAFIPFVPCRKNHPLDCLFARLRDVLFNRRMVERFVRRRSLDFIGVNYYTRHFIRWGGARLPSLLGTVCAEAHTHGRGALNTLGWEIYPDGLLEMLRRLKQYRLPVVVTENGTTVEDDRLREAFITSHIEAVQQALREGVPVEGYFYWSLMDNFEWAEGFKPQFGLVEVDPQTLARTVRPSAKRYALIIKGAQASSS